jgi:hypothetical protein
MHALCLIPAEGIEVTKCMQIIFISLNRSAKSAPYVELIHLNLSVVSPPPPSYVRDTECTSHFAKMLTKCDTKLTGERENSTASDTRAHDVHPFGQDAVFLPQSDLFNAEAVAHIADFYNLSGSAIKVPQHGIHHGIFSQPLPAFPPGFPVLFEVSFIAPSPHREYCHVAQCALATVSFICKKLRCLLYIFIPCLPCKENMPHCVCRVSPMPWSGLVPKRNTLCERRLGHLTLNIKGTDRTGKASSPHQTNVVQQLHHICRSRQQGKPCSGS